MSAFFNQISEQVSAFFGSNTTTKPSIFAFLEETPIPRFPAKKVIKGLIRRGADINERDEYGATLFHWILERKANSPQDKKLKKELVEFLIRNKADINAIDRNNLSALHVVADSGEKNLVEFLLDNGADMNAKDNTGATVLHAAAWSGEKDVVEFLFAKGADMNAKDNIGTTVLHAAAWSGEKDLVKFLLANGADMNATDNKGTTVLHYAAWSGEKDLVKFLLASGADINAKDNKGTTVLHLAVRSREEEVVKFVLAKGADINAKDNTGTTVLHAAAGLGEKGLVALLLANGADINAKDNTGTKVFYVAAQLPFVSLLHSRQTWQRKIELLSFLIDEGADIDAKDNEAQKLLQHLLKVLEWVESDAPKIHITFLNAVALDINRDFEKKKATEDLGKLKEERNKLLKLIEVLIQKGVRLNAADNQGQTLLHKVLKFLTSEELKNEELRLSALKASLEKQIDNQYNVSVDRMNILFADIGALEISEKERYEENCQRKLHSGLETYYAKKQELLACFKEQQFLMRERALGLAILYIKSGVAVTLPDSRGSTAISYIDKMENSDKEALNRAISEKSLWNIWRMETSDYTSFFQWLPQEMAEDVMNMPGRKHQQEKDSFSSLPRHTLC